MTSITIPPIMMRLCCSKKSSESYETRNGVCVGDEEGFHALPSFPSLGPSEAAMFTTSKGGKRFDVSVLQVGTSDEKKADFEIELDTSFDGQTIVGFGGAFTDSSAMNLLKMSPAVRSLVLEAYFGDSGLQYTVGRIPMASCDFSSGVYSYNDVDGDLEMSNFSIDVDEVSGKLPLIKDALALSKRKISLFASPWAPPAWMTEENSTINCRIQGNPGEPYWSAWALYFSKFLSAYHDEGIDMWAVTVQNEPVRQPLQVNHWQSQRFDSQTECDFIKLDLGPLLKESHPNVHIIAYDDQKDKVADWDSALSDPVARSYVSGTAFHWYTNVDFIFGLTGDFDKLEEKHRMHPDKFLMATEACEGFLPNHIGTGSGVKLDNPEITWKRGENYARDIIGDLQNWATGWTDWNLVLDKEGGPNWADNYCDAPIIVDTEGTDEFYLQPMYYIMGHFSKYITSGSKRIGTKVLTNESGIESVSFLTTENNLVVVMQYRGRTRDKKTVTFEIRINELSISGTIEKDSVVTVVVPYTVAIPL